MIERLFGEGKKRTLEGNWLKVKRGLSLITAIYLFAAILLYPEPLLHRSIIFSLMFAIIFISYRTPGSDIVSQVPVYDVILSILSLLVGLYIFLNIDRIIYRFPFVDEVYFTDTLFCILTVFLLLEGTRRIIGPWLPVLSIGSIIYVYLGDHIPGKLGHMGFSSKNIVDGLFLTTDGIWGSTMGIASSHIMVFMIFGAFLLNSGAGDFLFTLVSRVSGSGRGGVAKIAVLTSAMFGMVSGSAIANASTTGVMTIPIMKKNGYPSDFAAAIESCASVGGIFMPPIMGSVAFMMSDVVGIPYYQIAIISFLPAVIYFSALFFAVDAKAARIGLAGIERNVSIGVFSILKTGGGYFFPLFYLIFRLMRGVTPARVGIEAIALIVVISRVSKNNRMGIKLIVESLINGIEKSMMIVSTMGTCGILIGIIHTTGIAAKISSILVSLASFSGILTLLLVMGVAVFLGLAMNISSSYLLTAVICAPVLIRYGFEPISVHMFILFFSAMATITPPVALTSFAAASIAEAPPMKVGFLSMKTGVVAYILPFVFIFNPSILLIGSWTETLLAFVSAIAGVKLLSYGSEGWFLGRNIGRLSRAILAISGILVISGNLRNVGISVAATGILIAYYRLIAPRDSIERVEQLNESVEFNQNKMEGLDE